ncbi:MAG: ATP-binding protein [Gordonia sp. (in: high G+C Gram-positive bacteria)]
MSPSRKTRWPVLCRVQRVGSLLLGIAYLAVFFMAPSRVVEGALLAGWGWLTFAIAVVVTSSAALIAIGVWNRTEYLERVVLASAISYLALILAWFVAWNGNSIAEPSGLDYWVVFLPGVIGCAFGFCGRIAAAIAHVVVAGGLSLAAAVIAAGGTNVTEAFAAIWILTLLCVFEVISWAVAIGALRFDEERTAALRSTIASLPSGLRSAEERRLDAMIHDRLIATLVALRPGPVDESLVESVPSILDDLSNWSKQPATTVHQVAALEFAQRLRLFVENLDDGIDIETAVNCDPGTRFPSNVSEAIIEAIGEAIRNVHRHAGPGAACVVLCDVLDDSIAAMVVDDGVGFEPEAVSDARIGVSLGIMERMGQIDGGKGRVVSAPGSGTRVELTWSRPEARR